MGDCLGIVGLGVEQQRGQPAAPALALAGLVRLDPDIALDHVGGELVRVDEDRLGERDHGRGVDPGPGGELGGPAPGGARAGPERRPERFETAAGLELGLPEPPPHLVGFGPRTLAALDRVEERLDRLLDPHPDAHALRTAEHVGVDGVLAPDRPDHVVDKRTHASADSCGGLRRQPLWRPQTFVTFDKSGPDTRCPGPWSGGCNRRTVHILTRRSITETHERIAQLGWEPSYHDPTVRYPTRYRFPHKAKDPMKHIMREYLPMELEKDERVYGGLDAAVRADMPNKAHERWLEILKPFIVITNYAEVGAGRCMSMLMSAVPNNELRNGYHVQFVDEIRHTGMQMSLARWYAKNVPDPAGWNLGPKAFSGSVLTNPGLNMLSHFIVGDPIQCAFTLQVVAETAFTNIVFVALPDVAARNGDFTLPTTYLSVQSDEARHISNGYATLLTVLQDDHNAPLIERDLQQAFWINHAFIDIFAAVVLEYFSKDRSDPESYLDKWDRWVRDDWHRAYVLKLGKLGLDIPVDVFERARERLVAGIHHRHAILAFAAWPLSFWRFDPLDERDFEWFENKYPGWYAEYGAFWEAFRHGTDPAERVPAAQLHQHGATVLLDVPGVVRLRGRPAPSGRRRQRFGTAADALLLLSRMPVDG